MSQRPPRSGAMWPLGVGTITDEVTINNSIHFKIYIYMHIVIGNHGFTNIWLIMPKPRKINLTKSSLLCDASTLFIQSTQSGLHVFLLGLLNPWRAKELKGHVCFWCKFSIMFTNRVLDPNPLLFFFLFLFSQIWEVSSSRFHLWTKHKIHMMVIFFKSINKTPTIGIFLDTLLKILEAFWHQGKQNVDRYD